MQKASMIFARNLFAATTLAIMATPQFAWADSARQCTLQNAVMQGTYVVAGSEESGSVLRRADASRGVESVFHWRHSPSTVSATAGAAALS